MVQDWDSTPYERMLHRYVGMVSKNTGIQLLHINEYPRMEHWSGIQLIQGATLAHWILERVLLLPPPRLISPCLTMTDDADSVPSDGDQQRSTSVV